jgi:hypothetical protein
MRALLLAILIVATSSLVASQTTPNDPGAAPSPGTAPAAENPGHPQVQMPPDSKAPAPTSTSQTPAQNGTPNIASAASTEPRYLLAGADVRATLDTPLSTKTAKGGDRFTATVSSPVKDSTGNVGIPIGAKLNGQVSEDSDGKVATAIKDMGHLNLRFTDIQLPNGTDIPINATLLSVHNSKGGRLITTDTGRTPAIQPMGATGGVAGAFGPPLKGLAVGNLAGGGYVLATNGRQVSLPAQCGLRLRIDRNTLVP